MEPFEYENLFSTEETKEIREIETAYRDRDTSIKEYLWIRQNAAFAYLIKHPKKLIMSVNPFRLNERLTLQQGLFLTPGDVGASFEENLSISKNRFMRLMINSSVDVRKDILLNLHRMNISRATLFPGLSGFAESLRVRLANPEILSRGDIEILPIEFHNETEARKAEL